MSIFSKRPSARDKQVEEIIATAKSYVGYRARVNRVNQFGAKQGYDGLPWAGSFLETVLDESNTVGVPSLISTVAALAAFHRDSRVFREPKVGDIVFFAFSSESVDPFEQPHVGIVTNTDKWKVATSFDTIEGESESGAPRGPSGADGVYERTRFLTDVVAFARPVYRHVSDTTVPRPLTDEESTVPVLRVPHVQPNRTSKGVVLLQNALWRVTGAGDFTKGKFDIHTQSAVAAFQREHGIVKATGLVDDVTLKLLAEETHEEYFRTKS